MAASPRRSPDSGRHTEAGEYQPDPPRPNIQAELSTSEDQRADTTIKREEVEDSTLGSDSNTSSVRTNVPNSVVPQPNILQDADEDSKPPPATLEVDDELQITPFQHEVIDLTDDGPYNGHNLQPVGQSVEQRLVEAMRLPQSDTGFDISDFRESNSTLKDQESLLESERSNMAWQIDARERAEETEVAMAMIQAAADHFRNSFPVHPPYNSENAAKTDDINMNDSEATESDSEKKFNELKKYYSQRMETGEFNEIDEIDYTRACRAEEQRIRCRQINDAYDGRSEADENPMFFPDIYAESQSSGEGAEVGNKEDSNTEPKEMHPAGKAISKKGQSKKLGSRSKDALSGRIPKASKTKKRGQRPGQMDLIPSLLRNSNDLVAIAQANQQKPRQPTFTNTNKSKALNELISGMPNEQRKLHNIDRKELELASRIFTGTGAVKADGKGGWKLKGMKSSLHHYQLLGAAFMRERERKGRPYGGMIADEMGLGKTVLAIANIIDGQRANLNANYNVKAKATLVVAPSSLLNQWMQEIDKHAGRDRIKRVLLYRSESQYLVRDPVTELGQHDIIITSYSEVCKSWPKNSPPLTLCTEEAKADWWASQRKNNLGLLHQVDWHRIVLDEAHAIKNYLSRTSEAVCQLKGKHRWAISGTPIQNKLEEFYPFFRFIGIPQTGSFAAFKQNFCKKGSKLALQRLQVKLSRYMLRRTHDDQLLGAPILTLPNIRSETKTLKFSYIEKAIYSIIKDRFVLNVKAYVQAGSTDRKYQSIFVLLLRLRQVTAHCLLVQNTLKELLEESDLERLWKLTEDESHSEENDLIRGLKHALVKTVPDGPQPSQGEEDFVTPIRSRFRRCLEELRESGKWQEIADRTLCALCRFPPVDAHVTSCGHIYCHTCLKDLEWNAKSENNKNGLRCVECGANFDREERCSRGDLPNLNGQSPSSAQTGNRTATLNLEETDTDWLRIEGPIMQSAKTKAAVSQIEQWLRLDETKGQERSKIILFTQWRGMIKIMSRVCQERGWGCASFHGDMSFDARNKAIKRFSEDKECFVLLAGLKAGGVGLNLTAGNRVIIVDLWWNQFVETQAFCRVYRIGQEREVEVVRFVVQDSVDEKIVKMQERKNVEIHSAIEAQYRPSRLTTQELLSLFADDLERDVNGDPVEGPNEEPFVFTKDPYQMEDQAALLSD